MQYAYAYQLNGSQASGLDPDAKAYILAVEAADGQSLESGVKKAYNTFVKGCKSDGIWDAIKASCIMAGARTLSGSLVPLKGTAPTNFNFVSGDYARKTGLKGNASTKYLDSNRNVNIYPQNNFHMSMYVSQILISGSGYMGAGGAFAGSTQISAGPSLTIEFRNRNSASGVPTRPGDHAVGLIGQSRASSGSFITRGGGVTSTITQASQFPYNGSAFIFARNAGTPGLYVDGRLSFYSIGESVDLAKLDSRVSTLITSIAAAIP